MGLRGVQSTARQRRAAGVQALPQTNTAPPKGEAGEVLAPMDSASESGDNAGSAASQSRAEAAQQILGILQMIGATSPMEALNVVGLANLPLTEG